MSQYEYRRRGHGPRLAYGRLVRKERQIAGLSMKQLCDLVGIGMSQLSDIECGVQPLSLRRARQLAGAYGSTFADVIAAILQQRVVDAGFGNLRVTITVADESDEESVSQVVRQNRG